MLRKSIGIFIAATIGFLLISALGAYWALTIVKWSVPASSVTPPPPVEAKQTIKIFFGNSNLNKEMTDCALVYPVDREIDKTLAVGRAALDELLKGPTDAEANGGYFSSINAAAKINSLSIDKDVARVDFDQKMNEVGGSCRVSAIRSQITQTLTQFPTVSTVVISVDGNSEEALQP